jgi:hypothetical protein
MPATELTQNTEANACRAALIWTAVNVETALAANHPSDRDEFAAKAAPAKLQAAVFSVAAVAKYLSYQANRSGQAPLIR